MSENKKFVYDFTEGNKDLKDLLGGKGANLAEMTNLGLPVPPGFTITTEACKVYLDSGEEPAAPGADGSGAELNDQGFALLQQGDAERALPLLESAVSKLEGSTTLAEAYASYNLAVARFALGRCDGVLELLDRSEDVQGERKEIDRLRRQAEKRCEED